MCFACLIFASKLLILDPPPTRWDEAIMLGNGMQGSLIWMDPVKANQVNISLDRGDIWDLRQSEIFSKPDWNYKSMQMWVKEKNEAKLHEYFDWAYDNLAYPTKLPGGRIELVIDPHLTLTKFKLDLSRAEATLNDLNGRDIQAFESATKTVGMLRAPFSLTTWRRTSLRRGRPVGRHCIFKARSNAKPN